MAKKEMGLWDKTTDAVKDETKQIVETIEKEKAKDKRGIAEKLKDPDRRISGIKIGIWVGVIYMFIKVYQRTPLKEEINRLFEEDVI